MTDQDRTLLTDRLNSIIKDAKALQSRLNALEEIVGSIPEDQQAQQAAAVIADAWQDVCSAQLRLRALAKRLSRQ
jgi:uncharacterized coiled-coil protein SlyX